MDYTLAKQLKDAGFPFQAASKEDANDSKRRNQIFRYGQDNYGRAGSWLIPTLSELIESCGEHSQFKVQWKKAFRNWRAGAYDEGAVYADGSTSEEAVARLWLTLQAKK